MGVLDKYARTNFDEKKGRKIQVLLTEKEYQSYQSHLKRRGLTASEGTRYLILEEIGMYEDESINYTIKGLSDNHSHTVLKYSTEEEKTSSKVEKKRKRKSTSSSFSYNAWKYPVKTTEDVYCVHCKKWYQASTFKNRHSDPHGYKDMKDYIKRNLEKLDEEYEKEAGEKPDYDPKIFEDENTNVDS